MKLLLTLALLVQCCLEVTLEEGDVGTFKRVLKTPNFMDRTDMVRDFLFDDNFIAIVERHKRGRTSNLDMMKTFYEHLVDKNGVPLTEDERLRTKNYKLYSRTYFLKGKNTTLEIFQDPGFFDEHFGSYPVVCMNFKSWNGRTYDLFTGTGVKIFLSAYENFKYLLESPKLSAEDLEELGTYYKKLSDGKVFQVDLHRCMVCLCRMIRKHFGKKVILLIDDYEFPVGRAYEANTDNFKTIAPLFLTIITELLGSGNIDRALISAGEHFKNELKLPKCVSKYHYSEEYPYATYYKPLS